MEFRKLIIPGVIYGMAWKFSLYNELAGFMFLLVIGFIYGINLLIKGYVKDMFIAILISLSLGFISAIPFFGPLIAAAIIIYFSFKNLKDLSESSVLIISGLGMYISIIYAPLFFNEKYTEILEVSSNGIIDFIIGFSFFCGVTLCLSKLGHNLKKIFSFTLGLPGFIFLFILARKNSPFKNPDIS